MQPIQCSNLRQLWIKFFESKGHLQLPSASLLPAGDPTLLFTSAGMVPFKAYFEGSETPPNSRIVTIQKCLRTTDLEVVGKTARHCTFFEMLGNFSFGDYFKTEAIQWSWDFSINWLKLEEAKIHVTVYKDDQEAIDIWHKIVGVPLQRITKLGKDTNWWGPAGDSGPCGPCTELYLDRGSEICLSSNGCGHPDKCKPGDDCDRYLEYWNLVFNQYNQDKKGTLHPLPKTGIDTGAGLERIVALLNNSDTVYETNELIQIRNKVAELVEQITGKKPDNNENSLTAFRVLTDHSRSAVFALSDGILPDNTGRGYVVRRIIRRALLFAHHLGVQSPILHKLHSEIVSIYGGFYPELKKQESQVYEILLSEEQRFLTTLETGVRKYDEFLLESKAAETGVFSGKQAFVLYDTFGFPLEMTIELAQRHGLSVDTAEFEKLMQEQRDLARQQSNWKDFKLPPNWPLDEEAKSDFVGYDTLEASGVVLGIISGDTSVQQASANSELMIALSLTPFYPEGGGQLGDTGYLDFSGGRIRIEDTRKKGNLIFHIGKIEQGSIKVNDTVKATVDQDRRSALIRHHSATHLLNSGLRSVLGNHILQTGSLVSPDYLRFDFSHSKRLSSEELQRVEESVITAIQAKAEVTATIMPIAKAKETGAVATFGEKYGKQVRVLSMNDKHKNYSYSVEFCGGCHVTNTSDIQLFHIIKESSPGAGNRRIEAVAGQNVIQYFVNQFNDLQNVKDRLLAESANLEKIKTELESIVLPSPVEIEEKLLNSPKQSLQLEAELETLHLSFKDFEKQIRKSAHQTSNTDAGQVNDLLQEAKSIGKFKLVIAEIENSDVAALKALADKLREKESRIIFLAGSITDKGPAIVYSCTNEAVKVGLDCSELIRQTSIHIDGKGGGKKDMAQAGGKNSAGIKQALKAATQLIEKKLTA